MKCKSAILALMLFSSIAWGMMQETSAPSDQKNESQNSTTNLKNLAQKKQTLHDSGDETTSCCATLLQSLFGHLENARPLGFNLPPYHQRDMN